MVLAKRLGPSSNKGTQGIFTDAHQDGERSHLLSKNINLDTHITDIVNVMKWEDLENVCLVAHSYGGVPASGAIEQPWARRTHRGKPSKTTLLITS